MFGMADAAASCICRLPRPPFPLAPDCSRHSRHLVDTTQELAFDSITILINPIRCPRRPYVVSSSDNSEKYDQTHDKIGQRGVGAIFSWLLGKPTRVYCNKVGLDLRARPHFCRRGAKGQWCHGFVLSRSLW
ncbi:hypothetical protein LIA77_08964 [Sarocladium implicatum]|nr:hypothetical protein LIA77_08964 [Sarocladium implicatum]